MDRTAGIVKAVRRDERTTLIREFQAEMRVAKRDRLLAFRQFQQVLSKGGQFWPAHAPRSPCRNHRPV